MALWSFFSIYNSFFSVAAILANLVVVLLSTNKSIDTIQELRYFLSNIAVAYAIFAASLGSVQPQNIVRGTTTIRVPHGPASQLPPHILMIVVSIGIAAFLYTLLCFPLFFLYRLTILTNNTAYGHYFSKRNVTVALIALVVFSALEGTFFYYANVDHDFLTDKLNRTTDILTTQEEQHQASFIIALDGDPVQIVNILISTSTMIPQSATTPMNGPGGGLMLGPQLEQHFQQETRIYKAHLSLVGDDYQRNPLIYLACGVLVVTGTIAFLIVLLCAHFIIRALDKKRVTTFLFFVVSVLVHAIFVEASLPLIAAFPLLANAGLEYYYQNSLAWQEYIATMIFVVIPLITPLITLGCIKPYRRSIVGILTCAKLRSKPKTNEKADDDAGQVLPLPHTPRLRPSPLAMPPPTPVARSASPNFDKTIPKAPTPKRKNRTAVRQMT